MEIIWRLLFMGILMWLILLFVANNCRFSTTESMSRYETKVTNEQYTFSYLPTGKRRKYYNNETIRATSIAPFCCGKDNKVSHSSQYNDTTYDPNGVENNITSSCSTNDHSLRHMSNWGCACRMYNDPYEWDNLPSWDAIEFCRKLGMRKVLLFGDSTMHQAREFDWSIPHCLNHVIVKFLS